MPALTNRLQLLKHTLADVFRVADYEANWNALDASPGVFICTSGTRPTWGAQQEGMAIYETDTKLLWHWDGAAWERVLPSGLLGVDRITSDASNATTTYSTLVSAAVTVPAGNRRVLVTVSGSGVYSTADLTQFALYRDATLLQEWLEQGGQGVAATDRPRPISMSITDTPTAGAITYTCQFRATIEFGGTSTVVAGTNTPFEISVVEI